MSEELLQRGLDKKNPTAKIGKWDYYNIGATSLKALKEAGIIRNVDYGKQLETKKVDALIVDRKKVIAIIEFKQPKEFKTKEQKQKAIYQEIEVARKLDAKIIIATDTIDSVWVNALTGEFILDEKDKVIKENFSPTNEKIVSLIEKINYSINEKNNKILPKNLVNPTDLARSVWQDIWSVSGATPENCLYTFVELFIFKYLSDLGVLKNRHSFYFLMEMKNTDTNDEILQYYADEIRKKIKELFPPNILDKTTIINGTIFVSKDQKAVAGYSTVFMKVLEKFEKYGRLEHIDYDFKSQLFESFLKESISKKNWGQFFTPMKVVRAIERIAKDEIKEGAVICDPACGVGKFLLEPIKSKLEQFYTVSGKKVIPKITIEGFDKGFDKDEQKTIILAKANMLIYFSELIKDYPNHTVEFGEIFNNSFTLKTNSILGTLREPIENKYDLILTNPPYVTSGSSNLKEEISKDAELKKYFKINAIGVPDGIFNRQNDKNLREFIKQECYIDGIISLPLNTFFTTNKKTYILCITKKNKKADVQIDPVFTYLVSEIGETRDVYRFDIEQNDLDEATSRYNFFKGNKSSFENFNKDDARCKIFSIDKFEPETDWCIDRWWTKDEKIALGIEEESEYIKFQEFPYIIENIADTIMSFKNNILDLDEKKHSKLNYKEVLIDEIFETKKGSGKYTRKYGQEHKGEYPVYSGSNNEAIIHINTYDYDGKYLSWVVDGFAGYMKILNGKFSATGHKGILIQKVKNIDLDYIKFILEPLLRENAKGRKGDNGSNEYTNVAPSLVSKTKILIPILKNGEYDLKKQQEIAKKYQTIEQIKESIEKELKKLQEINVEI